MGSRCFFWTLYCFLSFSLALRGNIEGDSTSLVVNVGTTTWTDAQLMTKPLRESKHFDVQGIKANLGQVESRLDSIDTSFSAYKPESIHINFEFQNALRFPKELEEDLENSSLCKSKTPSLKSLVWEPYTLFKRFFTDAAG